MNLTFRPPLLLASLLALTLAGCAGQATQEDAPAQPPAATGADTGQVSPPSTGAGKPLVEPDSTAAKPLGSIGAPSQRSIYFEYDKYDVAGEFRNLVAEHGKFAIEKKDVKMLIQGNADERGSREYNLALGQRRADAVKRALLLQGVKEAQIESVSLGEEKPKGTGHDEASWAENRRADILYKGEY